MLNTQRTGLKRALDSRVQVLHRNVAVHLHLPLGGWPVLGALAPLALHQAGQHDDNARLLLPHHTPAGVVVVVDDVDVDVVVVSLIWCIFVLVFVLQDQVNQCRFCVRLRLQPVCGCNYG